MKNSFECRKASELTTGNEDVNVVGSFISVHSFCICNSPHQIVVM